jgi:hypothetical protein
MRLFTRRTFLLVNKSPGVTVCLVSTVPHFVIRATRAHQSISSPIPNGKAYFHLLAILLLLKLHFIGLWSESPDTIVEGKADFLSTLSQLRSLSRAAARRTSQSWGICRSQALQSLGRYAPSSSRMLLDHNPLLDDEIVQGFAKREEPTGKAMQDEAAPLNSVLIVLQPEPNYKKDEWVWMVLDGEDGSFKMQIASCAKWEEKEKAWKYEVRDTKGQLYKDGELVGEGSLNHKKK